MMIKIKAIILKKAKALFKIKIYKIRIFKQKQIRKI